MLTATMIRRALSVLGLSLAAWGPAPAAHPAWAADAGVPALADTGLFAPIAAQQAARLARLERLTARPPGPERIRLLIASGRADEAAGLLDRVLGETRDVTLAGARVHLARSDFAAARPLLERMAALPDPSDRERAILFEWRFLIDDAAEVDRLTRAASLAPHTRAPVPDLLAAGRLAYDLLDYARAESCFTRALEKSAAVARSSADAETEEAWQAQALVGLGKVAYKRRDYDGALERHRRALALDATPEALRWTADALIRLGRTAEAISACEWAVHLDPYDEVGHYFLGNGYARRNYTQIAAAYPAAFADSSESAALADADRLLADGDRAGARVAYRKLRDTRPPWVEPWVRIASLDFEEGHFNEARSLCFAALERCPEYGRAHAVLAKALESQRFGVDVHRPDYERRFAAAPTPEVPDIDRFVTNWRSLSPRHQKRVALSVAPWKQFLPVLIAGGSTYYIKPLYMLLSDTPGGETLRDQRINYDSRLWDDVRGAGGYHTVTGVEDVERTIFDRYNTVLHEMTHQVHAVLTADQSREIQRLYVAAKARDDSTRNGFLSRYAGGSVYEYLAEGANALLSPRRDAYDPREVVRERLDAIDPDLRNEVEKLMAISDVGPSYPVAFTNAGDDRLERGEVDEAIEWYGKALERSPEEETALRSLVRALTLGNRGTEAVAASERAMKAHGSSGEVVAASAQALWHAGRGLDAALKLLDRARPKVRATDRYLVDQTRARLCWVRGDARGALAASDSVIAYQSDQPQGLWLRAAALGLARRWDEAFPAYDRAVRMRTGVADLRCDYARDLLRAGRREAARAQLDEARLLDEENPTAEALRGWVELEAGEPEAARAHLTQALEWGPWCDLARILLGAVELSAGRADSASAQWAPVRRRLEEKRPPEYVYRPRLATWEAVHELPAVERELLAGYQKR